MQKLSRKSAWNLQYLLTTGSQPTFSGILHANIIKTTQNIARFFCNSWPSGDVQYQNFYSGLNSKTSIPWAVRHSWLENAYSCPIFRRAILTRKISQTDLVFGVRSLGSISRSMRARLQVCVQWLQFVPSWLTSRDTDRQYFYHAACDSSASWAKKLSYSPLSDTRRKHKTAKL